MKKVMLGVLLIGFFMVGFVTAASCGVGNDDQLIMRLYQPTNSHVSAWNVNAATYTEEVCYNKIFGSTYVGSNPHDCDGTGAGATNRIFSLYSTGNSHAAKDYDATNYKENVCYGNLECVYDETPGNTCANGGVVLVRMYSGTNSHVSNASNTVYGKKICCVATELLWLDMDGNEIVKGVTDMPNIGDTIQAVVTGAGSAGSFTIKEEDTIDDDEIRVNVPGSYANSRLNYSWKITQADLRKTNNDFEDFYFRSTLTGTDKSERIKIDSNYSDSTMNITIISPECADDFPVNSKIEIIISASDKDDRLDGFVTIDGDVIEDTSFTNGGIVFNHTFDSAGNYQIIAKATNKRGKSARHIANIMIINTNDNGAKYVAACIKEPKDYDDLEDSVVKFNAATTKAIEIVGNLAVPTFPGSKRLSWYWTFYPQEIIKNFINKADSKAYDFTADFPIAGGNSASLRVEFN